jgi:hypothetical protein
MMKTRVDPYICFSQVLSPHPDADLIIEALQPLRINNDDLEVQPVRFYCCSSALAAVSDHIAAFCRFKTHSGPSVIHVAYDDDIVYEVLRIMHTATVFWSQRLASNLAQFLQCCDFFQLSDLRTLRSALAPVIQESSPTTVASILRDPVIFGSPAGGRASVGAAVREAILEMIVEICPEEASAEALGNLHYQHLSEVGSPGRGIACHLPETVTLRAFGAGDKRTTKRRGALVSEAFTESSPDVAFTSGGQQLLGSDILPPEVILIPNHLVSSFTTMLRDANNGSRRTEWLEAWAAGADMSDYDLPEVDEVCAPAFADSLPFTLEVSEARARSQQSVVVRLPNGEVWAEGVYLPCSSCDGRYPHIEVGRSLAADFVGVLDTLFRWHEVILDTSMVILRINSLHASVLLPIARRSLHLTVFLAYALSTGGVERQRRPISASNGGDRVMNGAEFDAALRIARSPEGADPSLLN